MTKEGGDLNIVGIITARWGSIRLPFKNIKILAGKPLIAYMIMAARHSQYLKRVIVSTDDPEIKKISLKYKAEVPFVRPKRISGNCASVLVTQHAVRYIEREEKRNVDIAVTLQPTSPFCTSEDIDKCIDILVTKKGICSTFSAKRIDQHPEWMFGIKNSNRAEPLSPGAIRGRRATRQGLKNLVIANGSIYATRRTTLFNEGSLISKKAAVYVMPKERSLDIDDEMDFKFAEFLMKTRLSVSHKQ